jgi:hypothetical protein
VPPSPAAASPSPTVVSPSPDQADSKPAPTAAAATPAPADEAAAGTGAAAGDASVIVVPGITRYHRDGCILIRFLGAEDLERMTRTEAEAADCVPCKACQPDKDPA